LAHNFFRGPIHCFDSLLGQRLDVAALGHRNIRMPQNGLDRLVVNAQVVQVGRKAPPERVPAVPLWPGSIAFVFVSVLRHVVRFANVAHFAAIQHRQN